MRVLFRITGILVVTAALLTWIILAMGWSDLFDLPGFESAKSPSPQPTVVTSPAVKPAPPPRADTPAPVPPKQHARVEVVEVKPPVDRPEQTIQGVAKKAEAAKPERLALPGPVAEMPRAPPPSVEPSVVRASPPPAPAAKPEPERAPSPAVVAEPIRPNPAPVAAPAETRRAPPEATPVPAVTSSTKPAPAPAPSPAAQPNDAAKSPAAKRIVEVAPLPSIPPRGARVVVDTQPPPAPPPLQPKAQPQSEQRAAPSTPAPATAQKWVATRRIAGYGPDALLDQLDDPRRARDDLPCVVFERVQFKAGTAAPMRSVSFELDLMAKSLGAVPDARVEIGSRIGTTRMTLANQRLAADRARFVRDALVARGIPSERLWMDTRTAYHDLISDDLGRMGINVARAPSVGVCVVSATV